MKAKQLIKQIKGIFLNQKNYITKKIVVNFDYERKFIGDYWNFVTYEILKKQPPRIYHTASPFDTISNKSCEQALVFQNGKLELNIDFTKYVQMRTAVMNPLLFQLLGIRKLSDKNIIIFGSGNIAQWTLKYLKEIYPDLKTIDFINHSGKTTEFITHAKTNKVKAEFQKVPDLSKYDILIFHTSAESPILKPSDITKIKKDAIITSFRSSSPKGEIASEFYNTNINNVILDSKESLQYDDVKLASKLNILNSKRIFTLEAILKGKKLLKNKKITIFRSFGTPLQDVAVLKLLKKL